ncbi:MAG: Gfo/Idh/MocA family oxidoreductase [Armatimonadetes bacterium]|nr:Gfo/Idh/MocA family oxidoreductase [Candidatus Hippobium faecium]
MKEVRFGIVGIGNMGKGHIENFEKGKIKGARLVAVCDVVESKKDEYPNYKFYTDYKEMIDSGEIDAVIIAVPHYGHTYVGIYALEHGIHTIVEKPISAHKADCEKLIAAHKDKNIVFSAMFNQRTIPQHIKIKSLIPEVGAIQRITMIATHWFRSQAYYNSGTWRATWDGEGGGVLLNQMPHHLDLFQWLCGMPSSVRATCTLGKYHDIEVEDDVNATLFYDNGAVGNIITTTGEFPGSFHLEIAGDKGQIVFRDGVIRVIKNEMSVREFDRTNTNDWGNPKIESDVSYREEMLQHLDQHANITQNVVNAILYGEKLIAPAEEGINSVELANAMILSSMKDKTVSLPMDSEEYKDLLFKLIEDKKKNL